MSSENVMKFKYLGTLLTNQYSIHEKTESILNSGNASYYWVQNISSSQTYSAFGLCPKLGILETRKHNFRKLDQFPSSGGGKTPNPVGSVRNTMLAISELFTAFCAISLIHTLDCECKRRDLLIFEMKRSEQVMDWPTESRALNILVRQHTSIPQSLCFKLLENTNANAQSLQILNIQAISFTLSRSTYVNLQFHEC
jgi:hypothetical protein